LSNLIWMAIQDTVVIASGMKSVLSPTYRKWAKLTISAIYRKNFNPQIFTDINLC
jgi:hypothetical protein